MDAKNIVQQGELLKFKVTSNRLDLDMDEVDFYVEIKFGLLGKKITIPKSDFVYGTAGEWVMMFPTDEIVGKVVARFVWQHHDTDVQPGDERQEVDEQIIAFVVTTPNPQMIICPAPSNYHDVLYERTEESDIGSLYLRLTVPRHITPPSGEPYTVWEPVITRNDEYVYVRRIEEDAQQVEVVSNE